jgi:hypothetical protein
MLLRAFFVDRELLAPLMSDAEWLNLKVQRPKVRLRCCDSTGYLRTSKLGTKHFVHGKDRICNWAPETWQHLLAKTEIVRVCQQFGGRRNQGWVGCVALRGRGYDISALA